jgi:hypothetical protein
MYQHTNPFIGGPPIQHPSNFYGREETTQRFFELVANGQQMQSLSILGSAYSGKTSFLNYVRNPDTCQTYLDMKNIKRLIFVYIESRACGNGPTEFYEHLIRETAYSIDKLSENTEPSPLTNCKSFDEVALYFNNLSLKGWRCILLLDNFDSLAKSSSFNGDFFGKLCSLVTGKDIAWVTTSFRSLEALSYEGGTGSPFNTIFYPLPIYISAFSDKEAINLIKMENGPEGPHFDKDDIEYVINLAGHMPYPLQVACSTLFQAHKDGNSGVEGRKYAETCSELDEKLQKYFNRIWKQLSNDEKLTMSNLAEGILSNKKLNIFNNLKKYGLIEEKNGSFMVSGTAFKDWILDQ